MEGARAQITIQPRTLPSYLLTHGSDSLIVCFLELCLMLSDIFLSVPSLPTTKGLPHLPSLAGDISSEAIIMQIFGSLNNKVNPDMDYRIYIPLEYHT